MASPVAFGDIAKAFELITWIRRSCIDADQNVQVKYHEFKQEIDGLERSLTEFQSAFHQAVSQVGDYESNLLISNPRDDLLKQEADGLVGDFVSTLKDCATLLKKYSKFDTQPGKFLDNGSWHFSVQAQVEDLRRRIQAHTDKLSLFVESVRLRLETDIAATTYDIREILMVHTGMARTDVLPTIPFRLDERFRDALQRHTTIQIAHTSHIPLKEGVDVMIFHYRQSMTGSTGSVNDHTVQQYLHLLKAHWVAEVLLNSDALKETRPGHLYRRVIKQVKENIAKQYERNELYQYTEDELCTLNKQDFDIWPTKAPISEPSLTEPIGREEMLARLPVVSQSPNEKVELFVFRVNSRNLRIVHVRSSSEQRVRETQTFFDLHNDRLVPFYVIATGPRTEWSMQMFYGNGVSQADYPLQTRDAAFDLLQAFIGHKTVAYSENVLCDAIFEKSMLFQDKVIVSSGVIQLLQWPEPNPAPHGPKSPLPNGTLNSTGSGSSYTQAAWTFREVNSGLTSISEAESGKTLVVTSELPPPMILAFTQECNTYTFWQIELDHVEIETANENPLVLSFGGAKTGETFPVRLLSVAKSELKYWDLCSLFADPKLSAKGRKFKDNGRAKIKTREFTHLKLHFQDTKAKDEFKINLVIVMTKRKKQKNEQIYAQAVAEKEAQSPKVAIYSDPSSSRRGSSLRLHLTKSSKVSLPYKLPPIELVPKLSMDSISTISERRYSTNKEPG